jgi:hypothetical protein
MLLRYERQLKAEIYARQAAEAAAAEALAIASAGQQQQGSSATSDLAHEHDLLQQVCW